MNVEELRDYCLSLPQASEYFPFDETTLAFRVREKIFAIKPHMNKKYWNQVDMNGSLSDEFIKSLIRHSYSEVVKKLTNKVKQQNPELLTVK